MATEDATKAKIAEKIKKLLALGSSPNENEAAAAVAKAQALMFAYNLGIEDLVDTKVSEVGERNTGMNILVTWQSRLAQAVAASSLCGLFVVDQHRIIGGKYTAKHDRTIVFVGRAHDAELAELIMGWLMGELNRLSNQYADLLRDENRTPAQRKIARRSWLEGAAATVANRLMAEFSARRSGTGGSALVVHMTADIEDYLATKGLIRGKATTSLRKHDGAAYAKGAMDGGAVALRPGSHRASSMQAQLKG